MALRPDKTPIWKRWQRYPMNLRVIEKHGGPVGLIPFSLGCTVLDVDVGESNALTDTHRPLCAVATPRGTHAYYRDSIGRRNGKWTAYGCLGDIRGRSGYVVLYPTAPSRLLAALLDTPEQECRFPEGKFARLRPIAKDVIGVASAGDLNCVIERHGSNLLFDMLRRWAYEAICDFYPRRESQWHASVLAHAKALDDTNGNSNSTPATIRIARAVSEWIWMNGTSFLARRTALSERQRVRGLASGRARRARTQERDHQIVDAVLCGYSHREVARVYSLDQSTVGRIFGRDTGLTGGA